MEPNLQEIQTSVSELRAEVKKAAPDPAKLAKINEFLDTAEEKVIQPLNRAAQENANLRAELKELEAKLVARGDVSDKEIKTRIDAFEVELARRGVENKAAANFREKPEYKALRAYCQFGDGAKLADEHKVLLRTDSNTEGGYTVTSEMDSEITKRITEIDPIRSIARVRTIGSKSIEMVQRTGIPVATYEGEAEEDDQSSSTYGNETVTPFRQSHTVPITMDLLMNSSFNMESELLDDASEAFAFGEGAGFVSGTGFKQPEGFVTNAVLQAAARASGVSGVLTPNSLILLTGDLKVGYNPVYVLNRRTLALIRTFRGDAASPGDAAGQFLWMPGLNGPVAATLNGFPYILANSMPDVAASAFPVAFGDFRRGYTIVDRTGTSVTRDDVTQKRKAIVEFTVRRWNTGRVTLTEAIKLLQITA